MIFIKSDWSLELNNNRFGFQVNKKNDLKFFFLESVAKKKAKIGS